MICEISLFYYFGVFLDIFFGLFRIGNCLDVKLWRYKYYIINLYVFYYIESVGGIVWFYVKMCFVIICFLY